MYSEVRVYDASGNLKKTIPVQELRKRSDNLFKTGQNHYLKSIVLPGSKNKPVGAKSRNKEKINKICNICGTEFSHCRKNVTTCFSGECREALKEANNSKARVKTKVLAKGNSKNKLKIKG